MKTLQHLFENNRQWVAKIQQSHPEMFRELAKQQRPKYLWIGCSDSRVPANQIVGLAPGEVFVHRNIANQVIHSDMNCMAVLEYAVDVLRTEHVIVCGHYGCGGVQAAMGEGSLDLVDNWIAGIRDTRRRHEGELSQIGEEPRRFERLCELNVVEQVRRVCNSSVVQDAWNQGRDLCVHGWIYSIADGLLNDLNLCITSAEEAGPTFAAAAAQT